MASNTEIKKSIQSKLSRYCGVSADEATKSQMYQCVIMTVRDILAQKKGDFKEIVKAQHTKRVYYLCMEYLLGKSLRNNLANLGLEDGYREVLSEMGFSLNELYDMEQDPGLGNGGLGRLAACFSDALTTGEYYTTGFTLLYEYGLFKQMIIDGNQAELPDSWLESGEHWLIRRPDKTFPVRFGGRIEEDWSSGHCTVKHIEYNEIQAVPYDMLISGYDSRAVSTLRLWSAKDVSKFNMGLFSRGQYHKAIESENDAEILTKVLYPADNHTEGKLLRLSQQYFLVSASIQNIICDHLARYGTLDNFTEKVAIHINDTHPVMVVPEMMRILLDTYSYSWEKAWDIVLKSVSYTNHTVLPEALEVWSADLVRLRLPRIFMIIEEINRRLCENLWAMYPGDWDRISRMSVVAYGQVRMANLAVAASHHINGVSKLHSEILKDSLFHDFYKAYPDRFTNVTNGIAHRRWLCQSNPGLTKLLDETIGTDYRKHPETLSEFAKFASDGAVLDKIAEIKQQNKLRLASDVFKAQGIKLDINSVFDVQAKRFHEYKRQLLNVLKIMTRITEIQNSPDTDVQPVTYIFGGKAAAGYYLAKEIISLIWNLSKHIDADPKLREKIRVCFLENYNVTMAEKLMPASEISEQISLAGKEASGTGCMKFMINGAMTLGTYDGANIEMLEAVGEENFYLFGLRADEAENIIQHGYDPVSYYRKNPRIKAAVDYMSGNINGISFDSLSEYLVSSQHGTPDPYMCLADFESYYAAAQAALSDYGDRKKWNRMSVLNIAAAGRFSADRSVKEYADNIWGIAPIK